MDRVSRKSERTKNQESKATKESTPVDRLAGVKQRRQGSSEFVWAGWSPGDGDRIVSLQLVEEGTDASDNMFVGCRFNGAVRKQFDAIETIGG